jgi:hypothetical protein
MVNDTTRLLGLDGSRAAPPTDLPYGAAPRTAGEGFTWRVVADAAHAEADCGQTSLAPIQGFRRPEVSRQQANC